MVAGRQGDTRSPSRRWRTGPLRVLLMLLALGLLVAACAEDEPDDVADDPDDDEVVEEDDDDDEPEPDEEADDDAEDEAAEDDAAEGSFEGETVTFVVPYDPGGGFDAQARLIEPYLEEELGATVTVDNQPGAGGFLAINNLATVEPDGTTIALMNLGAFIAADLAEDEGVQIDITDLSYIGRIFGGPVFAVVSEDSEYETWDDVLESDDFRFGSTGVGSSNHVTAEVLMDVFDMDGEVVPGFDSSGELELAVISGDVEGMTGSFDSRLPSIESGETRALLQLGEEPHEAIPDVPMATDYDLSEDEQAIIETHTDLQLLFRAIVGPPDMPEDRLQELQDALEAVLSNEEFIEDSEEQGNPAVHMGGDELRERVAEVLETAPQAYRDLMAEAEEE